MKPEVRQKLDSVFSYPFFQSVGKQLPSSVTPVGNWQTAMEAHSKSRKWENCRLMARNALWRSIESLSWERAQEWGPLSDELRPLIISFVEALLPKTCVPAKATEKLKPQLAWDIMFICLEFEDRDVVGSFFYLRYLDPWYAAGHFPCGWDGQQFPAGWDGVIRDGQLMVY